MMPANDRKQLASFKRFVKVRFGGILKTGTHYADGKACVREARAAWLGLPWSDHPDGDNASPTDRACQVLNDAAWSSDAVRTEACMPLGLLAESDAATEWAARYAEATIREIVPLALKAAATAAPSHGGKLLAVATRCKSEGSASAARAAYAAADAAARAAYAARAVRASDAAADAAARATYAARAADAAAAYAAADAAADAAARAAYAARAARASDAYAAADAAARAAYAARAADAAADAAARAEYAARAADAAAYAAYAADNNERDTVLRHAVALIIACHRGEWSSKEAALKQIAGGSDAGE
jgi:hypothetical protein